METVEIVEFVEIMENVEKMENVEYNRIGGERWNEKTLLASMISAY